MNNFVFISVTVGLQFRLTDNFLDVWCTWENLWACFIHVDANSKLLLTLQSTQVFCCPCAMATAPSHEKAGAAHVRL